jgi:hypothetical protein
MFIEIAELIRCPKAHEENFCVITPDHIEDRRIIDGVVGCPVCKAEYPIHQSVVDFGGVSTVRDHDSAPNMNVGAAMVQALLDLSSPGGCVALVGSAARVAGALARQLEGVHYIGINVPGGVEASRDVSLLHTPGIIPLRSASMRGVVLGADYADGLWIQEAERILLRGRRLVAFGDIEGPEGTIELAREGGIFVGEKNRPR